jgi:hypothetical protein
LFKYIYPILFTFFLVACSTKTIDSQTNNNNHEKDVQIQVEKHPPEIYLQITKKKYPIIMGSFSWNNIEADSAPPSVLTKGIEPLKVSSTTKINMEFSPDRRPVDLKMYYWEGNERGSEIELIDGFSFRAPKEKGEYIYEILAKWPEGLVHYAAKVKVVK